jgi:hypothetical protein
LATKLRVTSSQSFTFQPTWLSLIFSIIAFVIVAFLAWQAMRRNHFQRTTVFLELVRVFLVLAAILLLNQPEWKQEFHPDEKPTVVILLDHSYSMRTRDETALISSPSTSPAGYVSRHDAIESLTKLTSSQGPMSEFQLVSLPFSNDDPTGHSDLATPLETALKDFSNLQAVVLASDGDWNSGGSPVAVAERMRLKGIPIVAVPVGSKTQLPDLELLSFDLPSFGITGKTVNIPITIESSLPRATNTKIKLEASDGTVQEKEITLQAMGRTTTTLAWKSNQGGDFQLKATLPTIPEELLNDNNQKTATIAIREEQLKILVIESYPRWEYRYLRNALSRDPGVDVSCLLFQSGLSKVGGGSRDYIAEFPSTLEELSKYDVVFLGDVGLGDGQLTEEQCRLLKGLVQRQASGLVFMPGWKGHQLSLVQSPLGDLLPILFDDKQPEGWGSRTPAHFELTELGRRSLLTRLADSVEDNLAVWENLPGFQWHASVLRAKAGTDTLAVHQESTSAQGRVPLLVTQTYGVGKVLFMGTDGAWRWRKGVEDQYHYRFWGQVVRWMAYQRNMAKGEFMRLYYTPEQPSVRQTVFLNANVTEKNGEPMQKGDVTARIISPSGVLQTVRLERQGEEWGAFSNQFIPQEAGFYQITLRSSANDSQLETKVLVQGQSMERLGKPARPEVLDELAKVTRGVVSKPENVEQAIASLSNSNPPPLQVHRWQLWSHAGVAVTLIGLMAAFWIGRKMTGQV